MASQDEQDDQRARYEFNRVLEDLGDVRGRGTELVSLYITPDSNLDDTRDRINSEISEAQNIKSKSTRQNVVSALEAIQQALKSYRSTPDNGLVFLVGHKSAKGDTTEMVKHIFEPPQPVPVNLYRCDNVFHLEPLERMMGDKETYGLVVIDRNEATIGLLKGEYVEVLRHHQSMVPSKHTAGGQSQQRFERLIEEAAKSFYQEVADSVSKLFRRQENELQGVLVGGPGQTKNEWLKEANLHHEVENKIIETFDTGYADEYGLDELVDNAAETLRQRGLTREKDLMKDFLAEVRKEGGKFSYGEDQVRKRLRMGAVDKLLLSGSLRRARIDLSCGECGEDFNDTTEDPDKFKQNVPSCPECGSDDTGIEEIEDVVEELSSLAEERGTDIEFISQESEEGQMLANAFGGVAAILRFRIS